MGLKPERTGRKTFYDYAHTAGTTLSHLWKNKQLRQALFLVASTPKDKLHETVAKKAVKAVFPHYSEKQAQQTAKEVLEYAKAAWATPAPTSSPTPPGMPDTKPTPSPRLRTPQPLEPPPATTKSSAKVTGQTPFGATAAAGATRQTRMVEGVTPVSHFFSLASARPKITQEKYHGMKPGARLSTRVKHSELAGPIAPDHADSIINGFYANLRRITPANSTMFPWLARFCVGQFAQYKINSMKFHLITDRPTSTAGVSFAFVDVDPSDSLMNMNVPDKEGLLDLRQVFSYPHAVVGSVYENWSLHLKGSDLTGSVGGGVFYLASPVLDGKTWIQGWMPDNQAIQESAHTTVAGWFGYGTEGFTGYNSGYLMVEYDVTFYEPELEEREAWLARNASIDCFTVPGGYASMTNIFGGITSVEPSAWPDQMQKVAQGAANIIRIWDDKTLLLQAPGLFDLTIRIQAKTDTAKLTSSVGVVEPKIDTGGAAYRYLGAARSTILDYQVGAQSLHDNVMIYTWRIYVESQTYVQFGVAGDGFWSGFSSGVAQAEILRTLVQVRATQGQVWNAYYDGAMLDVARPP